ncbi:MAG: class I SAM-dependent methyltransferase [Salinivirgaceae bacterium]|nr:class I SAM-dependent methyltransferase [Salinivirgaceae bacterium]
MSKIKKDKISSAYRDSKNIYDGVLTQGNIFARAYIRFFWGGTDDVAIAQKLLSFIPNDFSGTILDVPCGTAVFTAEKWSRLTSAKITCLDYSADMLQQAEKRLAGAAHITLTQGDVGALPFENQSVDVVMSMNGFHAFPDKLKAFDETCRVLRKGGKFIACFYICGQLRRTDWLVRRILAPKGWFTPPFHTEAEVRQILQQRYTKVEIHTDNAILWCVCEK